MTANTTTAADLASVLGTVKERVDSYNSERKQLADSLRQIVANAQQLLSELGEPDSVTGRRLGRPKGRRGRPKGSRNKTTTGKRGRPKGSSLSAEARAKIAEAQRKRWAVIRAGSGKKK
jgi:hypothetical protein